MNHDQLRHNNFLETFWRSSLSSRSTWLGCTLSQRRWLNVNSATGNDGHRDGVADSASISEILEPTKVAGGTTATF